MPTPKEYAEGAVRMVAISPEDGSEVQINAAAVAYLQKDKFSRTIIGLIGGEKFTITDDFEELRTILRYIVPGREPQY